MTPIKARIEIIGIVLVLFVQLGSGIWFASDLNRRVCSLEEWRSVNIKITERLTAIEKENEGQAKDLSGLKIILERIESKISDTQKAVWEHAAEGRKRP